ncbi:hypothetical protein CN354_08570 [Bacillus cereus]|nr:hypothetical protein CN354_08570 [Bacillus cereus]
MKHEVNELFTKDTYISSVKENLETNSERLIHNIREILKFNYYSKIELVDFMIFIGSFDLSIMMFSMNREASEVFYEGNDSSVFAGSHELLERISYYNLSYDKSDEFWEFYEQNDEIISEDEEKIIVEWFIDCWNKANGRSIKLPAYCGFHDANKSFDLQKNKWVSDEGKWWD